MVILTRQQIDTAPDLAVTFVEVPEWGGSVGIRRLGVLEIARIQNECDKVKDADEDKQTLFGLRLVASGLCDEHGNRLYQDGELEALGKRSFTVVKSLMDTVIAHNGLGKDAVDDAKKNSPQT